MGSNPPRLPVGSGLEHAAAGSFGVRFKLRSLMIAVAAVAGLLAVMRAPTGLVVVFGLLYLALIGVLWAMFRRFRRLSALCFGVLVVLSSVYCAGLCVYVFNIRGVLMLFLGWFWCFPLVLATGLAWATAATRRSARPRRSLLVALPIVFALVALPLSMLLTFWPLRLAFLVSRPALERLADRVEAGEEITSPRWAGVFRLAGSAVDPTTGNIGLIIDPDPAGRSGFVRLRGGSGTPGTRSSGPFHNLNFDLELRSAWWYHSED